MRGIAFALKYIEWFGAAVFAAAMLLPAAPAFAGELYFLQIEGVQGGSAEKEHVHWIDLSGYELSVAGSSAGAAGGGAATHKAQSSLTVTKPADAASAALLAAANSGAHFKSAKLDVVRAGPQNRTVATIDLQNVGIGAYQQSAAGGGQTETLSLSFTSLTLGASPSAPNAKAAPDSAGGAYFLEIDGIPGAATEKRHKDWIVISGYEMAATGGTGPAGAGAASGHAASSMTVTKPGDETSAALLTAAQSGKHFKTAKIDVMGDKRRPEARLVMDNVTINSFKESATSAGRTDTLSLGYTKLTQ